MIHVLVSHDEDNCGKIFAVVDGPDIDLESEIKNWITDQIGLEPTYENAKTLEQRRQVFQEQNARVSSRRKLRFTDFLKYLSTMGFKTVVYKDVEVDPFSLENLDDK